MDNTNTRCKKLDEALDRGIIYAFDVIRAERGKGNRLVTRAVSFCSPAY